jgi:hypothetical protein
MTISSRGSRWGTAGRCQPQLLPTMPSPATGAACATALSTRSVTAVNGASSRDQPSGTSVSDHEDRHASSSDPMGCASFTVPENTEYGAPRPGRSTMPDRRPCAGRGGVVGVVMGGLGGDRAGPSAAGDLARFRARWSQAAMARLRCEPSADDPAIRTRSSLHVAGRRFCATGPEQVVRAVALLIVTAPGGALGLRAATVGGGSSGLRDGGRGGCDRAGGVGS